MYVKKHAPSGLRSLLDTLTRRTLFPDANQLVAKRHSSFFVRKTTTSRIGVFVLGELRSLRGAVNTSISPFSPGKWRRALNRLPHPLYG